MADLIGVLAPDEGYTLSALDDVKFLRANGPLPRTPVLYEPCIIVVCKGRKRGFFADREYVYDAQHYLVLSLPLAFESQTEASPEEPMLAISIRVDLAVLADLAMQVRAPSSDADAMGINSTPMDDRLGDAVVRLLEALVSPEETTVLAPSVIREIYYRVLSGAHSAALRAPLAHQSSFGRIGKALRLIHARYHEPLSVETLADAAAMSVAAFHAGFKSVTGTSPLQYIKATRLHKARMLMIQGGQNAALAASNVGYESASQFSREFKRFFGRSPVEEARFMKEAMALRARVEIPSAQARN
ncbi:AraC family transcriptional regulator [Cupriavidus sp. BIC8F]|uniref:AraC family transcriptional regulator n=1 Tax=Cupriavidus sp. BIC8F TaxID=3079014 RepID=UPI002916400A|nr:AraC family transcriptional regulator [Cupriavidus sp. BIC8F]